MLIEIANQKCVVLEKMILDNYFQHYERLRKNPENIDEIEKIIQNINATRDSGSGHIVTNEDNLEQINNLTNLMCDFRFIRNESHQNQHKEAILAGYKFENWLETRITTLMTFSNNFYDSILELMNEILSNIED